VNEGDEISKKCLEDTGSRLNTSRQTTDDVTKRVITQPEFIRCARYRIFLAEEAGAVWQYFPRSTQKRSRNSTTITPVFTKGPATERQEDRQPRPRHHGRLLYLEGPNSKTFSATPTEFVNP